MLELKNVTLRRGLKTLLNDVSLRIENGNRVGFVGRNGAGKTSLMQVMAGLAEIDDGQYSCDIKPDRVAYLEQSLPSSPISALEFVKSGDRDWQILQQQLILAEAADEGLKIAECYTRLEEIDGFTIDARAAIILHGLGFTNHDFTRYITEFSGGWQMRLQLAKVLLSRADFLLLDEPTNHLDLEAIAWFEEWLLAQNANVLFISHDRDFLDNICTQVLYLNDQKLKLYPGNYTDFVKQYELQLEIEARLRESIMKKREHMQKFVDRFRYKATKARQAQSRLKAIEKLTLAPAMQEESPFHFSFLPCQKLTSPILRIEGDIGYGTTPILAGVNLSVSDNDRIALLGVNGAGKSTLIKTLAGELPLMRGEMVTSTKLNIGYFSQQQLDSLDYDSTPLAHMLLQNAGIGESEARRFLGGFNINGERVFDKVSSFSGGEKARLALALLIYKAPNLLLLDEPTNHLDIQMREALIFALQDYQGAVMLVSHDRYFVNSVVDGLWLVKKGHVAKFQGDLNEYQAQVLLDKRSADVPVKKDKPVTNAKPVTINPKKLKKLEDDIDKLSAKEQQLSDQLGQPEYYEQGSEAKLKELQAQYALVKQALLDAEALWLESQ